MGEALMPATQKPRVFNGTAREWTSNPDLNQLFLLSTEVSFNHRLRARGHVFLNEVYDALGFSRTTLGTTLGWFWPAETVIDFGLSKTTDWLYPVITTNETRHIHLLIGDI